MQPGLHTHPLLGAAAALVAGLLMPLAFAPFGLWPLALFATMLMFWLWSQSGAGRAFWWGYVFGLGMFGLGVSWVAESFRFVNIGAWTAVPLTGLFVAFLALFPALLGYLLRRFPVTPVTYLVFFAPAAWVLMEWARGWFLTGFNWLELGYSQVDAPLAGWAPLLGVYGVNWLVALSAGLTLLLVSGRGRQRGFSLVGLMLIWATGPLLNGMQWTQVRGAPLKVALLQANIPQDRKWLPSERLPTLAWYRDLSRQYADADLVVWPETAIPAFRRDVRPYLAQLDAEARADHTSLILGIPVSRPGNGYVNAVIGLGRGSGEYHKRHLVPFGEYLPLKGLLQPVLDFLRIPMSDFGRGAAVQEPLRAAGLPLGISICYEGAFGRDILPSLPEAALLVNVSNDAWFGRSIAPAQHLQMARMRALETGRFLVRATNTGLTAIVDPKGQVIADLPPYKTASLSGEVWAMSGATPFVRMGNLPVVGLLLAVLITVLARRTGRSKSR